MAESAYTLEAFTASDGYRWYYRRYPAVGTPRAHLVCLHGIQSHGGWYENSCAQLARAGFEVCFLDRRGSGLNEQARGDMPSFRRLLDDIAEFLRGAKGDESGAPTKTSAISSRSALRAPLFLLGISWGGKLALALPRRHPGLVDGLLLLCPGLFPQRRVPFLRRLRIFLARLVNPCKLFPIPLNDPELFTATPRWLEFLRTDPLALHRATARFLVGSRRLDFYLRAAPATIKIPVLLLLAEKDRIIDNARTRAYCERFATTDREIVEFPGAHHTLEFEPEPDKFIADMCRWLERQVANR